MAAWQVANKLFPNTNYKETPVAVRIIGEFSSGKTRFVRELFGKLIPENLEPVSSRETQTLCPLEVTFGETPTLELIKREDDWANAAVLENLATFPDRTALLKKDAPNLRLRLTIPEERLILKEGDGYSEGKEPRLLRFIDYPGWNSEDDKKGLEALGLSSDWPNFALAYVCSALRAEAKTNRATLKIFLEALADGSLECAAAKTPIFLIITGADKHETPALATRLTEFARETLGESAEYFPLITMPVDFAAVDKKTLEEFRATFWEHLAKAGREVGKPARRKIFNDPAESAELISYLQRSCDWIKKLRSIHASLKPDGKYLGGRTMRFFDGLNGSAIGQKALKTWQNKISQSDSPKALVRMQIPDLPKDHLLRPWLDSYWLPRLEEPRQRLLKFLEELQNTLLEVNASVTDLEKWLGEKLDWRYAQAKNQQSFELLMTQVSKFPKNMDPTRLLSTLISLSLMEASFAENK